MYSANNEITVGYFPDTLPRDPVEINAFLEHVAIGQVIETLVKIDNEGNLIPNIAKNWFIEDGGKSFRFILNNNITFSNGRKLGSRDIKYSLLRHKDSSKSQSKNYLSNIEEIICLSDLEILFKLKEIQVSFLKILTRDHLGIVPEGWIFELKSEEPWIGSGAYRFFQKDGQYKFIKNELYRKSKDVKIKSWIALKATDVIKASKVLPVPDLILHIPVQTKEILAKDPRFQAVNFKKPMHFIQSSVWWYPLGKHYSDIKLQKNVMAIIDRMVMRLNEINKYELATGVVPKGIQGHILNRIDAPEPPLKFKETKTLKITAYAGDFDGFFGNNVHKEIEKEFNIKFDITKYDFINNDPKIVKPDILIASYAGGFSDPDGFLIVLGSILGVEPDQYLKESAKIYKSASKEQDWSVRGELFRKINESLIEKSEVVPAWKREMYIGKSTRLIDDTTLFSYSLKLERFMPK